MIKKSVTVKKSDLEIKKMKKDYRMTVIELIGMIQAKGLTIPTEILLDRYVEREILLFNDKFFLTIRVFDKIFGLPLYKELYVFDTHKKAQDFYNRLIIKLNKQ